MKIKIVGPKHKIVSTKGRFSEEILDFLSLCAEADAATVAVHRGRIVGFFRYAVYNDENNTLTLHAGGTWVDPNFRKQGLGSALWNIAINDVQPRKIIADVISRAGAALVHSIDNKVNVEVKVTYYHGTSRW